MSFDAIAKKMSLSAAAGEYLLYVGNRDGYKNFNVIVTALENKLVPPGLTFLCVGGEDASSLLSQLGEKGLGKHFEFVDYVDDDELAMLYRHALALVFPSKYEGFGLPVLEAMANECPVICSSTSAIPEVAGDAAIFFDPESPGTLAAAIEEMKTRKRDDMIKKGGANFNRFSVDESVRQLADLYREV
jgi:glycosyltransferase involved in cell wall biosynthesis